MIKKKLVEQLRHLAQEVYDNNYKSHAGICLQFNIYNDSRVVKESTYRTYTMLRAYMAPHTRYDGYLCPAGSRWEQRAMFCLLLAESIQQEK